MSLSPFSPILFEIEHFQERSITEYAMAAIQVVSYRQIVLDKKAAVETVPYFLADMHALFMNHVFARKQVCPRFSNPMPPL